MNSTHVRGTGNEPRRLLTFQLGDEPSAVPAARHRLADVLADQPMPADVVDSVLLVASELVANAVEHGGGAESLELDRERDAVLLRVWDGGLGRPEPHPLVLDSVRGRGLVLVEALASSWGYEPADGHKSVWSRFELAGA